MEYRLFRDQLPPCHETHRLEWPKDCAISDLTNRAWYTCAACNGKIYDRDRIKGLQTAPWVPAQPAAGQAIAGFHGNALNVPWTPMGEIAAEFLRAKRYPDSLQNFYNSWLALPWDPAVHGGDAVNLANVQACQAPATPGAYRTNQCHPDVLYLTGFVDVQSHEIWYVIRGWGTEDRSWLVSYGRAPVETDDLPAFRRALASVLGHNYGRFLVLAGIDSSWGERTSEVYALARALPRLVCCKGRRSERHQSLRRPRPPHPQTHPH